MRVTNFKKINNIIVIFSVLVLVGCYSSKEKREIITEGTFLYTEEIRHAEGFSIDYYKEFTKVTINNPWGNDQDRKSTRLNSSHVRISYAVFCLKKKKK